MPSWNADLYLRFAGERTQPALDLVSRVRLERPARIMDLGCGPGNSTAVIRSRWPQAEIVGLDNSPEMIAKARVDFPEAKWQLGNIAEWKPDRPFDLILTNAALHWVPDHASVIPHIFSQVAPGGALAVQVPAHLDSPVHRAILEIADQASWREQTARARVAVRVESPEFYYEALCREAASIDLWVTIYEHVMAGPEAIVEWIRGTGLRPFLESLRSEAQRDDFLARLLARVSADYPRRADGKILFPFRRLFFVAYRA